MPSLEQLAKNLENYRYYSGYGTFNANNLPYGKDRPGGGDSRQPFVVRGVDTRWSPSNFDDGLTPFGVVTLASRTAADLSRVTQFLYTTTKGPLFLLKQTGLQRLNPNTSANAYSFDKKIIPTQLYNPLGLNTLAQVALGGFGSRFTKHGLIPQTPEERSYEKIIIEKEKAGDSRLRSLAVQLPKEETDYIIKYAGGPGSIFGIGTTTIDRYYHSMKTSYIREDEVRSSIKVNQGFLYLPIETLRSIGGGGLDNGNRTYTFKPNSTSLTNTADIPQIPIETKEFDLKKDDFRAFKNEAVKDVDFSGNSNKYYTLPSSDYRKYNLEKRIGIATPRTASNRVDYTSTGSIENSDRINLISLYYNNAPILPEGSLLDINNREVKGETIRDLIKFRIKVYDNDRNLDPKGNSYGVYILFRAYITNVRRNVTSKWDAYKYVGRGESFYAYDGFTETVTVSFTIAASSRAEMKPLYQKLNYLISTLAPDYSSSGLMRGNISELTIGDFLLYQPGIITSLDMIIDEDSNWEIALSEPENAITGGDSDMHELPQLIKCTMTFIPIYNFLPRKSVEAPFIGIDGLSEKKEGKQWLKGKAALLNDVRTAPPVKNR